MKFIAMRELRNETSKVLDGLKKQDVVITRSGKPAAALIYLDEDLLEDYILAHHPTLLKELEESLREYEDKGGISHKEMKDLVLRGRR